MKFWNFFSKSNKEVDEALYKCADSYREFLEHIDYGHIQEFRNFKMKFKKESHYIRKEIVDCKDNDLKLFLINYFQQQLDYFNENLYGPYAARVDLDNFSDFVSKNCPYREKIDEAKNNYLASANKNEKFLKPGFSKLVDILDKQTNVPSPFSSNDLESRRNRLK